MAHRPMHPGEILADELAEIGMTPKKLADVIEVPVEPALSNPCRQARHDGRYRSAPQPLLRDLR
jgi:plasmid maintenance system antidote protein VapI